jgi:hypothetical protein
MKNIETQFIEACHKTAAAGLLLKQMEKSEG